MCEQTEEEIMNEIELMREQFENANFAVCIPIEDLDKKITHLTEIIIKTDFLCYCYSDLKRNSEYFYIKNSNITNRVVIEELIKNNFNPGCNHIFLEEIYQEDKNSCQFIMFFGS